MEPSPDLTAARAAWRDALLSRESFSPAHLRELEAHLDDAIDDLLARGLSAEEAFLIATRRLGAPEPLAAEFRKAGGAAFWDRRAQWMVLGIVVHFGSAALAQMLVVGVYLATRWLPPGWWRDGWMVRHLGAEEFGTHMRLLSFYHLANTAVFLGALLVLLRFYWRPARQSQQTE